MSQNRLSIKRSSIRTKLASYSAMAVGVIAGTADANAWVEYTDVIPDDSIGFANDTIFINLDNDTVIDFQVEVFYLNQLSISYNFVEIIANKSNAFVGKSTQTRYVPNSTLWSSYPFTYTVQYKPAVYNNYGNMICPSNSFYGGRGIMAAKWAQKTSWKNPLSYGYWASTNDKYAGVKFKIGANWHYGWIRMDVNATSNQVTVKDYAYDTVANACIVAGAVPASADTAFVTGVADVGDMTDGNDLEITFSQPPDTSTVGELRAIVVKNSKAWGFNRDSALAVPIGNYKVMTQGVGSTTFRFGTNDVDADGDTIDNYVRYNIFMLSIADGQKAQIHTLAPPSIPIELTTDIHPATTVILADTAERNDGSDLEIRFDSSMNERYISEYRAIVVQDSKAGGFILDTAQAVTAGNYTAVVPDGSGTYTISPGVAGNDHLGNPLQNGNTYVAFVLSVADGVNALEDSISLPSAQKTMQTLIRVDKATNVTAADVDSTTHGKDLEASFDKAASEGNITEYRVIAVKGTDAGSFNLTGAQNTLAGNYVSVTPNGSAKYTVNFDGIMDRDGDSIVEFDPYYAVFVMSVKDSSADFNNLSEASDTVMLTSDTTDTFISVEVNENDFKIYSAGGNIQLELNAFVPKESRVAVYTVSGKLLVDEKLTTKTKSIPMNGNTDNILVVTVTTPNAVISKKIFMNK